jgi:type IV secretory pathway VirB10-like protein
MADQPLNSAPQPPPKPISSKKWGVYAFVGIFGLFVLLEMITSLHSTSGARMSRQANTPPGLESVQQFEKQTKSMADELAKRRAALLKTIANPNFPDLLMPLPECNQAMRDELGGKYYTAQSTSGAPVHLICGPNNDWAIIPEAATSIQPMTAQQEQSMYWHGSIGNGVSAQEKKRQEQEKARLEALSSSSVALDYSLAKVSSVGAQPAAEEQPTTRVAKPLQRSEEGDSAAAVADSKPAKYDWDSYTGPLYRIFEGAVIETILTNRLDGEFTGPVNAMVTTDLWSRDHQHVLMPQGTRVLGEAVRVNTSGQRRLAVVFHRVIMPDGYSVDFDKFAGLDQQGASGLSGKVNTHWPKLIATAVLVGAIGGLAESGATGVGYSGVGAIRVGISEQAGQEATQILNRALNQIPTITVYEGTRVRVWVKSDVQLPAYENHTVSPTL